MGQRGVGLPVPALDPRCVGQRGVGLVPALDPRCVGQSSVGLVPALDPRCVGQRGVGLVPALDPRCPSDPPRLHTYFHSVQTTQTFINKTQAKCGTETAGLA